MKVLVTGANGFLGSEIVNNLERNNISVISLVRNKSKNHINEKTIVMSNFKSETEWADILDGIDVVVHLIARTHNTSEKDADTYPLYHDTNVVITETLCNAILGSSVKKLVFMSSIKVNGESTEFNPFNENSIEKPEDNYGITKREAELVIQKKFELSAKDYIIIRPPLIYGGKAKGNLEMLLKVIQKKIPLPFKCIRNARSIVSLSTLAKFTTLCVKETIIRNELFLVANNKIYTTSELIEKIAKDNAQTCIQFCIPTFILNAMLIAIGKGEISKKLLQDLQIDNSKAVFIAEKFSAKEIFN
jgi:nucleoside-diphosphate-sugar epimerase